MSAQPLSKVLREQTKQSLLSVENVIASIPDAMWETPYCDMPLWKHVYHTLHSLDRWLINPDDYREPPFHAPGLHDLDTPPAGDPLTRALLREYYLAIEEKITAYLDSLTDDMLSDYPPGCRWPRLALLLAQHRHLHTHMGMLMGFVVAATGLWPRVTGLEDTWQGAANGQANPNTGGSRYYNR